MSNSNIWETQLYELQARWRQPLDPGGLDDLNNLLREHLTGVHGWISHISCLQDDEDPRPSQELATRLRELADVHRQLLEYAERRAERSEERAAVRGA